MKVREALTRDITPWSAMRAQLWPEFSATNEQELRDYFSGHSIDIAKAFVLEDSDESLKGFIEINLRNFVEGSRESTVPYIEAWFIEADCRGKGYGQQLMQAAEAWALASGYRQLASDTTPDNTTSIAIHKHLGFRETERVVCFLKDLE